jgi:hypothetical protein
MRAAQAQMSEPDCGAAIQRISRARPDWWCAGLSIIAGLTMVEHSWRHWGHSHHHWMGFGEELVAWLAMITAMMVPLVLTPVRETAFRSLWDRRHRAMALFLVGYFLPWVALGTGVALLRTMPFAHTNAATGLGFIAAGLWVLTPWRRRALVGCHRTMPLAIDGWRADLDCLQFGRVIGVDCAVVCWPLMLACALSGHDVTAMIGGATVGAIERLSFRPRSRVVIAGSLILGMFYLAQAFLID